MDKQIQMTLNEIDQLPRDEWTTFDIVGPAEVTMNLNQFHELAADYRAKVARVEDLEQFVRSVQSVRFEIETETELHDYWGDSGGGGSFLIETMEDEDVVGEGSDCLEALLNWKGDKKWI